MLRKFVYLFFILLLQNSDCMIDGMIDFYFQTSVPVKLRAIVSSTDDAVTLYGEEGEKSDVLLKEENPEDAVRRAGLILILKKNAFSPRTVTIRDDSKKRDLLSIIITSQFGQPIVTMQTIDNTWKYALYKALPCGGSDSFVLAIGKNDEEVSDKAVKKHQPSGQMLIFSAVK